MVWSLFSKPALTRVLLPEPATPVKTVNTCLGIDVLRYLNCFVSQDRYYKNGSLHEYSLLNYVCDVMRLPVEVFEDSNSLYVPSNVISL